MDVYYQEMRRKSQPDDFLMEKGEITMQKNEATMTPQEHAQHIAHILLEAQRECRADIERVNDPKAQALFETVAEVVGGTVKALNDYTHQTEGVWQQAGYTTRQGTKTPDVSDMAVDVNASEPPPPVSKV
jgi:hypothetical protein